MRLVLLALAVVGLAACAEEDLCEGMELRCTGDMLEECDPEVGWIEAEDCAAGGQICHEEMGHCMDAPTT